MTGNNGVQLHTPRGGKSLGGLSIGVGGSSSAGGGKDAALRTFERVLRIDDATKRQAVWAILDCISRKVEF